MDTERSDDALMLSEKFTPVRLPEICAPRRDLMARLHAAALRQFVFVQAPAGSGKTISALLWLKASGRRDVWLGLDKFDDAPSVFYKLLATGVCSLQPDNETMRMVLASPAFSASPIEHMVRLLSELTPTAERFAIVLDDMHLIENREIIKSLPAVLKRLPHSFTVLILSRKECPEEFRPLIKDADVQMVTPEHLRFSEDEIRRYFGSLGRFLTPDESKFAYMATEGWAIGVNAVAKSGQIELGGEHYIFAAYFENHLWNNWKPSLRDFCLKTSVVDEFDAELAALLSGRNDAEQLMEELYRTNTFLSRLNEKTYRYHHLFLDFLREKAETALKLSPLYKEAANYYRAHKDYTRALRFWFMSGDYKGIDTFLYLFLFENNRGVIADYAEFLRGFFEHDFPPKAFRAFPALHVLCAWYHYLTSHRQEYESHMDAIYRKLPLIAAEDDSRFVEFAFLAYSVDHRFSILEKIKKFHHFERLIKKFTEEGLATNIASFTHNLPYLHRSNIDYSDLAVIENSMELLDGSISRLLGDEWQYIKLMLPACFGYERNQLDAALEYILAAKAKLQPNSKIEGRICTLVLEYSIRKRKNQAPEAEEVLRALTALTEAEAQFFLPNLKALRTRDALCDGDRSAARAWLNEYFIVENGHIELFRIYQHFTTARAYIALGELEKAERQLNLLMGYGREFRRPLDEGEALALFAAMKWAVGDKTTAVSALETALTLLQPYGFIRVFADEGAALLPALKQLGTKMERADASGKLKRDYLLEVTLACHAFSKNHRGITAYLSRGEKPVRLSKQQTLVLTLLSQGLRNADICEKTGLSLPTIKSHTAAAYAKLDVNNAMDAILKARELKLI